MKNYLLSLLAGGALALVAGCAAPGTFKAYPGAELPADRVATVRAPTSIEVRSINGHMQPNLTATSFKREYAIATLPGAQTWEIRYYAPFAGGYYADPQLVTESPWMPFQFTAAAGAEYRLKVATPDDDPKLRHAHPPVRFSIAATGQAATITPVAANVPPPPPPAPKVEAPQTLESAALGQLKKWWGVAGPDEQRAFRDWLKQQP